MNLEECYREMQKTSGIEVGDTVKVLRKAKDYEMGWSNCWADGMDAYVGETGEVTYVSSENIAVTFDDGEWYHFPFFVLEVMESAKKKQRYEIYDDEVDYSDNDAILISLEKDVDGTINLISVDKDGDAVCWIVGLHPEGHIERWGGIYEDFDTDDNGYIIDKTEKEDD